MPHRPSGGLLLTLTPARVSWLMTGLIAFGTASTLALSLGVVGQDSLLTILGVAGEVSVICVSMLVLFICARGSR